MHSVKVKLFLQYTLPKKALTVFGGLLANIKVVWIKNYLIRYFLRNHAVDMQEAIHESVAAYSSFNDFFTRHLKPGLRPISDTDVVSPVDGFVSEFGRIEKGQPHGARLVDHPCIIDDKSEDVVFPEFFSRPIFIVDTVLHNKKFLAGLVEQLDLLHQGFEKIGLDGDEDPIGMKTFEACGKIARALKADVEIITDARDCDPSSFYGGDQFLFDVHEKDILALSGQISGHDAPNRACSDDPDLSV